MEQWSGGSGDSGSPRRPPKGSKPMSAAARRTAELQEKNRRAQRRFRERQKSKVSELEAKVEELNGRIGALLQDKSAMDSRIGILNRVLRMREEHIELLQRKNTAPSAVEATDEQVDDLQLTAASGQPTTYTADQIQTLTRADAVAIWKGYVNQMAMLLVDVDAGGSEASSVGLQRLSQELCGFIMRMHMLNPLTTREFSAQRLEDSPDALPDTTSESSERWLSLARALHLSQHQRTEIVQLRRLFLSRMNGIAQQRQEIHSTLALAMPAPSFSRASAIQSLRTNDGIERLRNNLREEHMLKMDWVMTLLKHTLTPTQVARLLVQAWPWSPDTLAMATWIAAEENEPDALAMLAQATRSESAGLGGAAGCSPSAPPSSSSHFGALGLNAGALHPGSGAGMLPESLLSFPQLGGAGPGDFGAASGFAGGGGSGLNGGLSGGAGGFSRVLPTGSAPALPPMGAGGWAAAGLGGGGLGGQPGGGLGGGGAPVGLGSGLGGMQFPLSGSLPSLPSIPGSLSSLPLGSQRPFEMDDGGAGPSAGGVGGLPPMASQPPHY